MSFLVRSLALVGILCAVNATVSAWQKAPSEKQLAAWLKRFPAADTNNDGKLSAAEAIAFRRKRIPGRQRGVPREFSVDPGWMSEQFPDHAVCYQTPEQIRKAYAAVASAGTPVVFSHKKPADGSLRIVGTGHSFMAPGYASLPLITRAAGLQQPPLCTHTGGGITGSARYKWEEENGIFQFDGQPRPKLLASIANAEWDAMTWGPYYEDKPEYYACWIDFCLKYNPDMKFYLSDAWPQLEQFSKPPRSAADFTYEAVRELGEEKTRIYGRVIDQLRDDYPNRVFIMPTSDAMVLAVREFHAGNLPGVEGIHRAVGGHERSLWRDHLGHLGPGFGDLEGYVFYATLYGRSPELIDGPIRRKTADSYPSVELDHVFRKIAWEAVVHNPYSGVEDADQDGRADKSDAADTEI